MSRAITFFPTLYAPRAYNRVEVTFDALCEMLNKNVLPACPAKAADPKKADKDDHPMWSPADLRKDIPEDQQKVPGEVAKIGYRLTSNVISVAFFAGDIDGTRTWEEVETILTRLGWRAFVTSTPSSIDRMRIIVDTDRPITAEEYPRFWHAVASQLGCEIDKLCKDPARQWSMPCDSLDGAFWSEHFEGKPLCVDDVLASALPAETMPAPSASTAPPAIVNRAALVMALASGLMLDCPVTGKRTASAAPLAGALVRDGLVPDDEIPDVVHDACKAAGFGTLEAKRAYAEGTVTKYRRGDNVTSWPTLRDQYPHVFAALKAATANPFAGAFEAADVPTVSAEAFGAELDADADLPPIDWLVDGLIQRGSVNMFVAHGGSLKTWIALSMMLAVQSGKKWPRDGLYSGGYAVKQTNVLFLDYESGPYEVQRRIQILHGSAPRPRIRYEAHPGSLHNLKTWERIQACIREHGIGLVVLDSLSGGSGTEDENTPAFAAPLKIAAQVSDRTGCAFLFVHHANKNGEGHKAIRGSTAIHAACDAVFGFSEVSEDGNVKLTEMFVIKPGPGPTPKPVKLALSDADGLYKIHKEAVASAEEIMRSDILAHLDRGPSTQNEMERAVKGTSATKRKALADLVSEGEAVAIARRYHRDDPERRWERVRAALESEKDQKTADLARKAHVSKEDLDILARANKIWTSGGKWNLYGQTSIAEDEAALRKKEDAEERALSRNAAAQ